MITDYIVNRWISPISKNYKHIINDNTSLDNNWTMSSGHKIMYLILIYYINFRSFWSVLFD